MEAMRKNEEKCWGVGKRTGTTVDMSKYECEGRCEEGGSKKIWRDGRASRRTRGS